MTSLSRCLSKGWFMARPSRDFVPAADLLFAPPKSRQKALPCETAPAMLEAQGRAELAPLRSAQTGVAKSVLEACFARALGFCASRRFRRGGPETAEQPTARPASRVMDVFLYAPFSPAEERKTRSPRAQLASRTDSRRLFEQSVAARVRRGASGLSTAGNPSKARAGRSGGALWLLSGGPESDSPAGANSRHGPRHATNSTNEQPARAAE